MSHNDYFKANQALWDQRTQVHKDSDFYDVPGFLAGKESLTAIELSGVGDVTGKTLLHLQCHFGLDTLSWARHGAVVTGIDFSEAAIAEAQRLATLTALEADFICCNVYDTTAHLQEKQFDIIFTSYGVVGWLPDLDQWAAVIRRHLKPGGLFFIAEFHPVVWMFDDNFTRIQYAYHNAEVIETDSKGTYTDKNAAISAKEYGWNHSLSEVVTALLRQGLQITAFDEYAYSPYPCFNNLVPAGPGKWHIQGLEDKIPMVYAISAANLCLPAYT